MRTLSIILLMGTLSTAGCRAQLFGPSLSCAFDEKGNVDCYTDDPASIADEAGQIAASDTAPWQAELLNKVERDLQECDKTHGSRKAVKRLHTDMDALRQSERHTKHWLKTQEFI